MILLYIVSLTVVLDSITGTGSHSGRSPIAKKKRFEVSAAKRDDKVDTNRPATSRDLARGKSSGSPADSGRIQSLRMIEKLLVENPKMSIEEISFAGKRKFGYEFDLGNWEIKHVVRMIDLEKEAAEIVGSSKSSVCKSKTIETR